MSRSTTINSILNQVKHLDYSDQLNLVERLVKILKKENKKTSSRYKLTDLDGLGSEIWEGIDIESYIDEQRKWD